MLGAEVVSGTGEIVVSGGTVSTVNARSAGALAFPSVSAAVT